MSEHHPEPDEDSRPWWDALARHLLTYQTCTDCNGVVFYPRNRCCHCLSDALQWHQSLGLGTVYSRTLVHRAPDPRMRDQLPYPVALIDLDEGFRMMSRLVGPDANQTPIGARVQVVFGLGPDGRPLPFFEPVDPVAAPDKRGDANGGGHETT
ncbi:MAG: putative nucleic-acid-binding protein containing a Zn-ribbon [Rhodobacteraceae bacterium HLUCCA12]|nr:MAG: putative nucleic-acid-binding protein containing a Zn-ribbon [Rhodobacteraceae bacterium HLUCCA12]